jgi:acyl-CoA hydrolase
MMRLVSEGRLASVLGGLPGPPRVVAGGNFATPWRALAIADGVLPRYRLFALNAQPGMPSREGVTLETPFVGPGMRGQPRLRYFPCRLSLVPALLASALAPDVVLVQASVPSGGTVSLGTEVNVLPAAIEAARARGGLVIAQLNRQVPYTFGDAVLPLDAVDYAFEAEATLPSPAGRRPEETSAVIGDRVAALVGDGATLQAGIGAVPDAVLAGLARRRGLSVWSEMFSDGVLGLAKAGALDPDQPVTGSFAFGSADLYTWMDRNPDVRMLRTETVNDPARIARQSRMTSINGALQVDLFAQANATWVNGRVHSGLGGQADFVVGALHSPGGQAIIALPSWHPKAGVSTVLPRVEGPVTSFQHTYIVSEQGAAAVWGHDATGQAEQVIGNVAHPSAREQLREAGRALGLGF